VRVRLHKQKAPSVEGSGALCVEFRAISSWQLLCSPTLAAASSGTNEEWAKHAIDPQYYHHQHCGAPL
jgi:hypothetical protein